MITRNFLLSTMGIFIAGCATDSNQPLSGQQLAQSMCTQCHVIERRSPDELPRARQTGAPPDFSTVANEPNTNADSLRQFLKLPHGAMNNILLREEDIDKVVEFILDQKQG